MALVMLNHRARATRALFALATLGVSASPAAAQYSPITAAPVQADPGAALAEAMPFDTHMEVEIDKPKLASGGGTLFERMSNIARGAAQAEATDGEAPAIRREPLDIPRFLNRQNNQ